MNASSYRTRAGRPAALAPRTPADIARRVRESAIEIDIELCPEREVLEVVRCTPPLITVRLRCLHQEDIRPLRGPTTRDAWAAQCPVGTRVIFEPVRGDATREVSRTRSEPWVLGHGEAVVAIEGRAGGVALSHLELVPERARCRACGRRADAE